MSEIGLILALGCAAFSGLALLCKHRGAMAAPDVAMRSPLRSAAALFRSRWWAIGFGLATLGWAMHVVALSMAPLSVVQAVIAGGLALLAVPARRWFGVAVGTRDLLGLGLCAAGLSFLALTAGHSDPHGTFTGSTMLAFEGGTLALVGLLLFASAQRRLVSRGWVLLAVAAGSSLGVSDVAIKALTGLGGEGPLGVLLSPWLAVTIVASVVAFYASARGLQDGEPVPVIASTSTAANVSTILGGIVVFGDPMPGDTVGMALQVFAFALVIVAALIVPPPMRAAEANAQPA